MIPYLILGAMVVVWWGFLTWPDWPILARCSHRPGTTVTITDPDGSQRRYVNASKKRRRTWLFGAEPTPGYRTSATVYFEKVT